MTVTWVLNNGSYEVSSKEHLLQIMHNGGLYQNAGSVPTDYRSVSFLQTADIDLESDIANIRVITVFSGTYDGQGFAVSNWSCTALPTKGTGFFGHTRNAVIKNMVLNGVWKTLNTIDGAFFAAHNTSSQFYNIATDFAPGTEITATAESLGGLFSYTGACSLQNITLGGTIDRFEGTANTGGVVGFSGYSAGSTFSYIRNIATFTTGIVNTGNNVGGILGHTGQGDSLSHVINAMRGSIHGPLNTGGLFGYVDGVTANHLCNSMIGDITGSKSSAIAAVVKSTGTPTHIVSYMTGDVNSGFMGDVTSTTFSSCVVAMTGATTHAAFASGHGSSQVLLDESYGITYSSNTGTVATMDTSTFDTHPSFAQPFFYLSFVDNASNPVEWPFVFGNVGTTTDHDWMVTIGSGVNMSFVGVSVLDVAGASAEPNVLVAVPGVFYVDLTWTAKDIHTSYMIHYSGSDGSTGKTMVSSGTSRRVRALVSDVEYEFSLFASSESGYEAYGSSVAITTLENLTANYNITDFHDDSGNINLSSFAPDELETIGEHINGLFDTGSSVIHKVKNNIVKTTFVKRGSSIPPSPAIFAPFSKSSGSNQVFTLTTADGDVEVGYDEVNDHVVVGGDACSDGQYLVVDGQKMSVFSV